MRASTVAATLFYLPPSRTMQDWAHRVPETFAGVLGHADLRQLGFAGWCCSILMVLTEMCTSRSAFTLVPGF